MKPTKDVLFGLVLYAGQGVIQLDRDAAGCSISVDLLVLAVRDGTDG